MARYLISFDDGAMDFIPEEEMFAVGDAAHAVIRDAQEAGVWVFAGGVYPHDEVSVRVVAPDGTVTDGAESKVYIGGVTIIDVPSREEALRVGCQDRRRLPLCPRCPRVHARPGRGQLIGRSASSAGPASSHLIRSVL